MVLQTAQTEISIFSGVFAAPARAQRWRLFTLLSVACADGIRTLAFNSNGVWYLSSVVGAGLARLRRLKISVRWIFIHKEIYKNDSQD